MYFDSFFVYSVSIETGFRLASISHICHFWWGISRRITLNRRQNAIKGNVLDSYLLSNNLNKGDRGKLIDIKCRMI